MIDLLGEDLRLLAYGSRAWQAEALRLILLDLGVPDPGPAKLVFEGHPRRRWHIRRLHDSGTERGHVVAACYRLAWDEACRDLGAGDEVEALARILALTLEAA